MKKIRILALLCALVMLMSSFVACKTTGDDPKDTGASTQGTTVTGNGETSSGTAEDEKTQEELEREMFRPDRINWGDKNGPYEYRMLVSEAITYSKDYWVENEELSGDALNTAMADRADFLGEYFNIAFEVLFQPNSYITTSSNATVDYADIVVQWAHTAYSGGVLAGHFLDLNQVDGLNMEASYWDQRIQKDYNIGGRLFSLEGDFSVMDELCTQVVLFNADLYERYGYKNTYGSPYTMASNGLWTFDTMLEMFQGTSQGAEDGGKLDKDDVWGMLSEEQAPYALFIGSGHKIAYSDDQGDVQLLFDENYENTYNIIADIMNRFGMDDECLFVGCWNGSVLTGDVWEAVSNMFKANQALFRSTALVDATYLRDMEATFGVLPIPMYTEKQEGGYYSLLGLHCPLFIPFAAKAHHHLEKTAALTEGLAFFSRYADNGQSIYDAFFENMTYVKLCRNEEDRLMLELIFSNKAYDLDKTMNIVGVNTVMVSMMRSGKIDTMSSDIKGLQESASTNLRDFLETIESKVK